MNALRRAYDALRARPIPLALGLVFFLQIFYFQWHPAYPNPNEVVRLYLTRALVEDRSVRIDGPIARFGDVEDKSQKDGHAYCDKAPGLSFAAVPVLAVAKVFGTPDMRTLRHLAWLALIALPSLLLLIGLWRYLGERGLGDPERALVLLAFGLGSLWYTFSTLLFSHAFAANLAMASFLSVARCKRDGPRWSTLAWSGFLAGLAVISEYPIALPLFFAFVWLCAGPAWKRAWVFVLAGLVPVALAMLYNQQAFGGPLQTGYKHLAVAYFQNVHDQGFMGVSTPKWEAFVGSFFAPSRGLFAYAPWLLLALPGLFFMLRERARRGEGLVVLFSLLGYGYFISSFGYWVGGGTVGQRHLTPLVPFLVPAVAEVVRRARGRVLVEVPVRVLVAFSIVVTVLCSIPWPFVSPAYPNPLSQISSEMWRAAILPPSIAEAAGLSVEASAVLFLALLGGALAYVAFSLTKASARRRVFAGSAVLALAAWAVVLYARIQHTPGTEAQHTRDRQGIARLVDPTSRAPALRERRALEAREPSLSPGERLRLGQLRARLGDNAAALRSYGEPSR